MTSQTLSEAKKYINDDIVLGVAEDIISVNPLYSYLPFAGYEGQAILVNRELAMGDAGMYSPTLGGGGDDGVITHKGASTVTQVPFSATKIIGDAEMDGLVQAQSVGGGVDQMSIEISSKAKSVGRLFQQGMATGTGSSPQMNSFGTLCDPTEQYVTADVDGRTISFELLDELIDLVKAKDGEVDFLMMPARTMRSYRTLLRALGGTPADWVVKTDDGRSVLTYEGIPIFKNEYMSVNEDFAGTGSGNNCSSVFAGCFDDGSMKVGVSAIHPIAVPGGIQVNPIGEKENRDESIWRVKQYANLACFNRRGLARLASITN